MEPEDTTWEQVARLMAVELAEVVLTTMFRDVQIQQLSNQVHDLQAQLDVEEGTDEPPVN